MTDPKNPRAYPSAAIADEFGGMTLRDAAALAALQGLLAGDWEKGSTVKYAKVAFDIADIFIAERKRRDD